MKLVRHLALTFAVLFLLAFPNTLSASEMRYDVGGRATEVPSAFSCDTATGIPKSECEALVALYHSTIGPGWIAKTDWLVTNTPCSWHRVYCTAAMCKCCSFTAISWPVPSHRS